MDSVIKHPISWRRGCVRVSAVFAESSPEAVAALRHKMPNAVETIRDGLIEFVGTCLDFDYIPDDAAPLPLYEAGFRRTPHGIVVRFRRIT